MGNSELKAIESGVRDLLNSGADTETVLQFMRDKGLGQPASVDVLVKVTKADVGEAQMVVFRSKTWADRLEINLQLQDALMEAVLEQQRENKDPDFKVEVEWEKTDWPKLKDS